MLVVMAGLPACGKSSIAEALGRETGVPVVSVDPIEAALWRCGAAREPATRIAGYMVAEAVAEGIVALGQSVIVDAANAVEPAREQWRGLALRRGVPLRFVEVTCSDIEVHRTRLATRVRDIEGYSEPSWEYVQQQRIDFAPWAEPDERLVLDSMDDIPANVRKIAGLLVQP